MTARTQAIADLKQNESRKCGVYNFPGGKHGVCMDINFINTEQWFSNFIARVRGWNFLYGVKDFAYL